MFGCDMEYAGEVVVGGCCTRVVLVTHGKARSAYSDLPLPTLRATCSPISSTCLKLTSTLTFKYFI